MKPFMLAVCLAALLAAPAFTLSRTPASAAAGRPDHLQIGLNFIRFFWESNDPNNPAPDYYQPDWILSDFEALGIHTFRQFVKADLMWNIIEPQDDHWQFEAADAVLLRPDLAVEPIVTLFAMQYSSPTPPWERDPARFEKTLGPEAQEYLETVIGRYGAAVRYWEIGNELDHWRVAEPGMTPLAGAPDARPPSVAPPEGFSPQEQGVFLAQVAAFIRERDADAVIVMPGMGSINTETIEYWLGGVLEGGGTDWFDVINYHYYGPWEPYGRMRAGLTKFIVEHGLTDKPVWVTETGSSSSPTLTIRTNYPNSPETQCADIFRRLLMAYAAGDTLAIWHTYIGSDDIPSNAWRLYGIRGDTGEALPAYYALQLFTQELIPFQAVTPLAADPRATNVYRVETAAGAVKYVAWGSGSYTLPQGVSELVSVMPGPDGSYTWQAVTPGTNITLSATPVLIR